MEEDGAVREPRGGARRRPALVAIAEAARGASRELVEPPEQLEPLRSGPPDSELGGGGKGGAADKDAAAAPAPAPLEVELELEAGGRRGSYSSLTPAEADDGVRRRGTVWSATAHTITAVIGAGVLSLPSAMATLGYAGGAICFAAFALITLYTAQLLADLYVIDGKRQRTYTQMVETTFGRRGEIAIAVVQLSNLVLTAIAYTITAAKTMQSLATSACAQSGNTTGCFNSYTPMVLIFGAAQLLLSQVPTLEALDWASVVGAAASFGYGIIAFGLSAAAAPSPPLGSVWGQGGDAWQNLAAIGNILFAYSFSFILLEIQDTIRGADARGPVRPMKRAVNVSLSVMTAFYVAVAVSGYAVFGDTAANQFGILIPDDILEGFPGPVWVVNLANALVLLHMIPAFQAWSQPFFGFVEDRAARRAKRRGAWRAPLTPVRFRVATRCVYVVAVAFLACLLPFFGLMLGLAGALGFWPATVLFPVECWLVVFKPRRSVRHALRALSVVCAIISLLCIVASVQQIVAASGTFELFGSSDVQVDNATA